MNGLSCNYKQNNFYNGPWPLAIPDDARNNYCSSQVIAIVFTVGLVLELLTASEVISICYASLVACVLGSAANCGFESYVFETFLSALVLKWNASVPDFFFTLKP